LIPELQAQVFVTDENRAARELLDEKVRNCQRELQSCANRADMLEAEVAKLQKDIFEAGGPLLKKQKASCDTVSADLKRAEKLLSTSRVEIHSAEKAESKASSAKKGLEEKLVECGNSLSAKEAAFKSLESGAFEVMRAYEEVKAVEAGKRSALDLVSSEVDQVKRSQIEIRCKEVELLGQLEAIEKQISDNRKKSNHWLKEISILEKFDDNPEFPEASGSTDVDQASDQAQAIVSASNGDDTLPRETWEKYDPEELKEIITTLQSERNMLAKNANMGAIAEYRKKEADYFSRCVRPMFHLSISTCPNKNPQTDLFFL
jgi:structural maintenance of chromosome 4